MTPTPTPGRRLHHHLDAPEDGVELRRGLNAVGGWVFHEARTVTQLQVLVDDRVYAVVDDFYERPDVAENFPQHRTALRSGFSVTLDWQDLDEGEVTLSLMAVLAPRDEAGGETQVVVTTVVCSVPPPLEPLDPSDAHFTMPRVVPSGFVRVSGLAAGSGGIANVKVTVDDGPPVRARLALPGHYEPVQDGTQWRASQPEDLVARFESMVPLRAGRAVLAGRAETCSGEVLAIDPIEIEVEDLTWHPADPTRRTVVQERITDRVTRLLPAPVHEGLRVLVITHSLALGGGQLYLQVLLRGLAERGVWCAVTSLDGGPLVVELEEMGFPVLVTGAYETTDPEAYDAHRLQVASFAAEHGCTVCVANTFNTHGAVSAAHLVGLPVTWVIHESYVPERFWREFYPEPWVHPFVAESAVRALGECRRVVFVADATRQLYDEYLPPGAGVVVPYAADVHDIDAYRATQSREDVRRHLGIAPETTMFLCIGSVEPRKAQLSLVQAFASSPTLLAGDVVLVVVGARTSSYVDALVRYVEGRHLEAKVRVEPVQADTYQWYLACDALVCASDVESLPRSMLEAMQFGRPVVSTAVFGVPDLVVDGESGFLCEVGDLREIRGALERALATGRDGLATMGAHARDVVLRTHRPDAFADYFYDALLGDASSVAGATAPDTA